MNVSEVMVKILENYGIEYCFGLPGEENLDFLEALRTSKIKLFVTRHEQAAAFMAATYGRLTGKPGLCLSTLGPGAMNLVNGIAYADLGGMPLIAITGQKAHRNNWQGHFQLVDTVGVMKPITKSARTITSPELAAPLTHEAILTAISERPGPVHLELPEDVAKEEVFHAERLTAALTVSKPVADTRSLAAAANLIAAAKRPVIILGSGANQKRVGTEVSALAHSLDIPVISAQLGKGVVADDDSHFIWSLGIQRRDYISPLIEGADLLITVGYFTNEHPPSLWNKQQDKKIIHINGSLPQLDGHYLPTITLMGDLAASLTALSELTTGVKCESAYWKEQKTFLTQKRQEKSDLDSFPLAPPRIVAEVRQVMDRDDIVTLDNGIYKMWFARHYPTYEPLTFLFDHSLATMGAGLPSAMAAKLLYPAKKVLAVCGDGGFMMNSQELITCIKEGLPVVILILNDNAFGFIEWKQRGQQLPDFGMKLENPDFVKYAESYGALGLRVTSAADLGSKLQEAFASGRPTIVECPIDYSENYRVFNEELRKLS